MSVDAYQRFSSFEIQFRLKKENRVLGRSFFDGPVITNKDCTTIQSFDKYYD